MIKNYNKKTRLGLLKTSVFGAFLAVSGWASAQISGTVTLGTGGTYSDWAALASAISTNGVSGALTVNVISDVTTSSTVTFTQNASNPTSSTKTITINGGGYKLSSSATNAAIVLSGMDYMTIDNVVIQKTGTGTAQFGVIFTGGADYNTISKCTIEYTALTSGSTAGGAYVAFTNSTSSATSMSSSVYAGSYNSIEKNLMRTTNSNSPGPTYGVIDYGSSSLYSYSPTNNTVNGNTIENFYYYGLYTYYTNGDQFTNNDISRANSTSNTGYSLNYGVYGYYVYSTNRSFSVSGNKIHDLPFKGATSGYTSTFYGIYAYRCYGTSSNYINISDNTFENIICNSTNYIVYGYYNYYTKYNANKVLKWKSLGTSSYHYGFYMYYHYNDHIFTNNVVRDCEFKYYTYQVYSYYGDRKEFNNNKIVNNKYAVGSSGWTYMWYIYYPSNGYTNEFNENLVDSNEFGYYAYITYMYYWNGLVNKNRITNNYISSSSSYGGYIYAMSNFYFFNLQMNNNLIANNTGYYGLMGLYAYSYNSGSYRAECKQNSLVVDAANAGYSYHYTYGLYFYPYYHSQIDVTGNSIDIRNSYGAYPAYTYNMNGASAYKRWDYNNYYLKNVSYQYWYCPNGSANDLAGWNNIGFAGPNETGHMPVYKDAAKADYRIDVFELQNRVPQFASTWPNTPTTNEEDITEAKRNKVKSDHGAFENYMNISAVKTDFTIPSQVCAGYSTSANIYIKNEFVDTVYGFNVAMEADNGGTKVTEKVTTKILSGNTEEVKITVPITLSTAGKTKIKIFVDAADDNLRDDTLYFETDVLPAPGGANFRNPSAKSTAAVYQLGKANDVTVIKQPVIYDIPAPTKYSNSTYGTSSGDWQAFVTAVTKGGRTISGASLTPPTASSNMEVKFVTSDASLEDTMITIILRVLDNNNGCDTFVKRNVFIYPSVTPLFTVPSQICEGNAVLFENKSKVLSGSMEFKWNFGTGNAADTTDAPEPVFQFPGNGTYKVKLTAKTVPFGFAFDTIIDVTVNPIPTIAFTKTNACEGENLTFTNKTTPSAAKSTWNFGDGTTSTVANPTKKYAKAGQYTVTLNADLGGCIATMTQKVYQFTRPDADFDKVVGSCENDEFEFNNKTTVTAGLFGSNWNFDDNGNVSTDLNPTHDFQTSGTKNVKLMVTSEFGCKDSVVKSIVVKPSPKASFVNGPLCSVKPTDFTNTTPDVSGTIANYAWSFGDGSTSGAKSPTKDWFGNLGPKKVTLKVTLDNGCTESVSKDLVVLTQPKPNFSAEDVCAGEDVIFVNNTTWAQGDITYRWNFGDGTESTNSDPTKKYNTSVTLTPFITLYAYIQGGCGDSITKNITINETPRTCDFVAAADYSSGFYGMKFDPINTSGVVGGQNGVSYIWVFEGGGTKKSADANATVTNNFATDGTYKVTMRAMMTQTKCECSVSKLVEMNRSSAESLMTSGVAVYPNPNNGQFTVATTEAFGKNVTVEVMSLSGAVVKRMSNQVGGMISVDASEVSNGMYLVKVMSGDKVVSTKINIQH